jgi:hypothetical protein
VGLQGLTAQPLARMLGLIQTDSESGEEESAEAALKAR